MRLCVCCTALVVVASATAGRVAAQWYVGLGLAVTHYGGTARDTSGNPNARPGDATMVGVRVERSVGRARVGLRLSYGKPGLTLTGQALTITDRSSGQLIEASAPINFRVGGIGPSGAVRAEVGPTLHLWRAGDEIRSRLGALGAIGYEWPVTNRLLGSLRLEGMLSSSWFNPNELPPEFERRATWRYGVGLGLAYRL